MTLYRLTGIGAAPERMLEVFDAPDLDDLGANIEVIDLAGCQALFIEADFHDDDSEWCADAQVTTGLPIVHERHDSAGLLLPAVDGVVYALGYGGGHRLIPDELKDTRFGLSFVARRLDPDQVQGLVRRVIGAAGRVDSTLAPGGLPLWTLALDGSIDVVRRLGGRMRDLPVTFSASDDRPVRVEGGVGLRIRLGVKAADLVADIRRIARVLREEQPHAALEFVDHIKPVGDELVHVQLDADLDARLGRPDPPGVVAVTPASVLDDGATARGYRVRIGSVPCDMETFDSDVLLRRCRVQPEGKRTRALRHGRIDAFADRRYEQRLGGAKAVKWIEATASLGSHRYFLMEGEWYEIRGEYLAEKRAEIAGLFKAVPSLDLPEWDRRVHPDEGDYNEYVPRARGGYVCLDKKNVRTDLHRTHGVEMCDLLGPDDELIHVKRAEKSTALSHLFAQALVAVRTLVLSSEARAGFAATVAARGKERTVPADFMPKKVVFAILLDRHDEVSPDTLFPFSQVTLAQTARMLHAHHVEVEVVGINSSR
jgi:uncharacterized protein (TIGR04141 family)